GDFDDSFNDGGTVTTDFGGNDSASSVALDNLGNIVVAGVVNSNKTGLARYEPDGTPDPNFGTNGKAIDSNDTSSSVNGVVVLPDGTITVGHLFFTQNVANGGAIEFSNHGSFIRQDSRRGVNVYGIAMMADGEVVQGGYDTAEGQPRIARVLGNDELIIGPL